jgi:uncharacterized protein
VRELVEFLARELVDDPDAVRVDEAPDDMGKVIGRGGRTAKAMRSVVRAAATRQGISARVDIAD